MPSEHENTDSFLHKRIFDYFKRQKVTISNAIKTTFPFLESLRDHEFITGKMYDDLQDSLRALVPVHKVIYRALEELEKDFKMEVLNELFNEVNMEKYPDLKPIRQNFEYVFPNELCFQGNDGGDPSSQLSLEQGPSGSCSQASLTWSPLDPSSSKVWRSNDRRNFSLIQVNQTENHQLSESPNHLAPSLPEDGLSEDFRETVQINRMKRDATTNTGNNTEPERKPVIMPGGPGSVPEDSRELQVQMDGREAATPELPWGAVHVNHELQINPCFVDLVDIKKENSSFFLDVNQQTQARTNQNEDSEIIELSSGDSDDGDDGNNFSNASTSVPSQPVPAYSRKPPTRRTYRRGDVGNNPILRKDVGKRRKKRERLGNYSIRNIKIPMRTRWRTAFFRRPVNSSSQRGRKRGPRIPREDADFSKSKLPVTCGDAKGTLCKELLKQGAHMKSIFIQSENKQIQITPKEFEMKGNRARSKNWKQSIRCNGWTLRELIEEGKLEGPPRKKKEKLQGPPRKKKEKLQGPPRKKVAIS